MLLLTVKPQALLIIIINNENYSNIQQYVYCIQVMRIKLWCVYAMWRSIINPNTPQSADAISTSTCSSDGTLIAAMVAIKDTSSNDALPLIGCASPDWSTRYSEWEYRVDQSGEAHPRLLPSAWRSRPGIRDISSVVQGGGGVVLFHPGGFISPPFPWGYLFSIPFLPGFILFLPGIFYLSPPFFTCFHRNIILYFTTVFMPVWLW